MSRSRVVIAGLLICITTVAGLPAVETEQETESERPQIFVGAGAVVRSEPYDGVDAKIYPIPLFGYEGKRLYLRGITVGYRLIQIKGWSIGPTVRPRFDGYEASDSSALRGMKDRNRTIDGGIELAWRTNWGLISTVFVTDLLGAHDGHEMELSYTARFPYAGFNIIPSVGLVWRSRNLVDYYYGVRPSEVGPGRLTYAPGEAVSPLARLAVRRKMSERWGLLLETQYEWLGNVISVSPIVESDSILSVLLGLTYSF